MPARKNDITPRRAVKLVLYDKVLAQLHDVERKGDTIPYTSLNSHMFSFLDKDDTLALRLPKEAIAPFLQKYKTKQHEAYGIVQKEYVDVPDTLLKKTAELAPFFELSYTYVSGLKPKPTKTAATKQAAPKKAASAK